MKQEDFRIRCDDAVSLAATVYSPSAPLKGAVVVCAALGVPRRFYFAFARFLAENGYATATFDYRGIGASAAGRRPGCELTMADWGSRDIDAVLKALAARFDPPTLFVVGHSCGGQLFGLAEHSRRLSGAILVAASLANARLWPWSMRLGLLLLWHIAVPALSARGDRFPARLLGLSSVDVPTGVMAQWACWARRPDYLFDPRFGLDTRRYREFGAPILSYGFTDDAYAPRPAIEALLAHFPMAGIDARTVAPAEVGLNRIRHFGYFKETVRDSLWRATVAWLDRVQGNGC